MQIVYIILAYRNPAQLARLVERLDTSSAFFLVHIDKRIHPEIYAKFVSSLAAFSNLEFLKRHDFYWGTFSHVRVSLKAVQELFSHNIPFDYMVQLTESDYPIKSNSRISTILSQLKGKALMSYNSVPYDHWPNRGLDRFESWHIHFRNWDFVIPANPTYHYKKKSMRVVPIPFFQIKRKIPYGLAPYGGSSYWAFSRECVEYIVEFLSRHPRYIPFFKRVTLNEELFFQTILVNSHLRAKIENRSSGYMDWSKPRIPLAEQDLPALAHSDHLFARKFDMTHNQVLDRVDEMISSDRSQTGLGK